MGLAFDDLAVVERTGLGLVEVRDDVGGLAGVLRDERPLDAGREPGAAPASQADVFTTSITSAGVIPSAVRRPSYPPAAVYPSMPNTFGSSQFAVTTLVAEAAERLTRLLDAREDPGGIAEVLRRAAP